MMLYMAKLDILLVKKSGITYIFLYYFAKIKVDSYDSLSIGNTSTLLYVTILGKSVSNKDKNHYY